jgi:hypothetical protein
MFVKYIFNPFAISKEKYVIHLSVNQYSPRSQNLDIKKP